MTRKKKTKKTHKTMNTETPKIMTMVMAEKMTTEMNTEMSIKTIITTMMAMEPTKMMNSNLKQSKILSH